MLYSLNNKTIKVNMQKDIGSDIYIVDTKDNATDFYVQVFGRNAETIDRIVNIVERCIPEWESIRLFTGTETVPNKRRIIHLNGDGGLL